MERGVPKLAALAIVLAVTACGQEDRAAVPSTSVATAKLRGCHTVGRDERGIIRLCQEYRPDTHGSFVVDDGGGRQVLAIPSPGPTATASDAGRVGHWAWAALSPDGLTLLGQWSAECEVPIAFFMPAKGGKPRVVTGEEDWAASPTSVALGWSTDGRAIVLFPSASPCGTAGKAGLYLIGIDGTHTRIRGADRFANNLPRSIQPRSVASLERS
jgi:hypothetical protein